MYYIYAYLFAILHTYLKDYRQNLNEKQRKHEVQGKTTT